MIVETKAAGGARGEHGERAKLKAMFSGSDFVVAHARGAREEARAAREAAARDARETGTNAAEQARRAARVFLVALASALVLLSVACGRGGTATQNAPPPQKSDFERSLETVKRGQYVKIYVIRRKDGGPLQADDKLFLRQNTPMETGMWVLTEDSRTAIAGANFDFEPKHFQALSERFNVEDYTGK
jgi:hypothetical protein